jgi:hypothetical protein
MRFHSNGTYDAWAYFLDDNANRHSEIKLWPDSLNDWGSDFDADLCVKTIMEVSE